MAKNMLAAIHGLDEAETFAVAVAVVFVTVFGGAFAGTFAHTITLTHAIAAT